MAIGLVGVKVGAGAGLGVVEFCVAAGVLGVVALSLHAIKLAHSNAPMNHDGML